MQAAFKVCSSYTNRPRWERGRHAGHASAKLETSAQPPQYMLTAPPSSCFQDSIHFPNSLDRSTMLILSAFVAQVVSGTMLAQNVLAPDENAIRLSPKLGEIPGGSDLVYCPESRDTDLFSIERLEVYPTPPLLYVNHPLDKAALTFLPLARERYVAIHIYGE